MPRCTVEIGRGVKFQHNVPVYRDDDPADEGIRG
jgi:hypothetical protein